MLPGNFQGSFIFNNLSDLPPKSPLSPLFQRGGPISEGTVGVFVYRGVGSGLTIDDSFIPAANQEMISKNTFGVTIREGMPCR